MSQQRTLEERLTRSLETQAGGLHDAPFDLADVRGRATSIRRRRRAVAAGVVAAVVAVALPVALLAGPGDDSSRRVDPAAPRPQAAYVADGVVHLPGERAVALPGEVRDQPTVAVLTDGRIVATTGRRLVVLAPDGAVQSRHRVRLNALTVGEEHRVVAWQAPDRTLRVLSADVAAPVALPGVPVAGEAEAMLDAVVGTDCAGGECRVLAGDGSITDESVGVDGATDLDTSEPLHILDVSPDGTTWAVQYADDSDPQFGCVGLYDPAAARMTARSCGETALLRFSPDGRRLFGMMGDGGTWSDIEVLDLDLRVTAVLDPAPRLVGGAAWDDPETLLVTLSSRRGDTWTVERIDVSTGRREVVAGPAPGSEGLPPYRVAE